MNSDHAFLTHRFRIQALEHIHRAGFGSTGIVLAYIDALAALYFGKIHHQPALKYDPTRPQWTQRDYVILSSPEAALVQYLCLAEAGFFETSRLNSFGQFGSSIPFYPSTEVPGIDATIQRSGEGLRVGYEWASTLFHQKQSNRVYVFLGDEDLVKGSTWEASMDVAYDRLDHLIAVCVYTGLQKVHPVADKFQAFGWQVIKMVDGHDSEEFLHAVSRSHEPSRRPTLILAPSILGKGVAFAERKHNYAKAVFSAEEMAEALHSLGSVGRP